ncbi:MAG: hypothetical protein B2I17_01740 [Thermoplasmatales archaeon B_DKE]|nr:MAG: hypothetical protein B2I17_01740 [Thermoplasmatales archaeon B_DKE]
MSFADARRLAIEHADPVEETETVSTGESAGRICALDVYSRVPLPPFTRSEVDGYAVVSADLSTASPENPIELLLAGNAEIGNPPLTHPGPGSCLYIATGAAMPSFCDSVAMVEDTIKVGNKVRFTRNVASWENVAHSGEDVSRGTLIARRDSVVDPRTVAVLCAAGVDKIKAYRKIRIGIASSGNELLHPGEEISAGKIYESNSTYVKAELSKFCNVSTKSYGFIRDDMEEVRRMISRMLTENDAIILSGGTSAGEGDFVYRVLEMENPGIVFHGVSVKPGTPTVFAMSGKKPVFGLPGFPVSAMMIFRTIFLPAIEKMSRERSAVRPVTVTLAMKTLLRVGYTSLIIMRLVRRGSTIYGYPVNGASGSIARLLDAEGFAIMEGNRKYADAGEKVDAYLFSESIPESVFLGTPDEIAETFILNLVSHPAVVKMDENSVRSFIIEIVPDITLVSGTTIVNPEDYGNYTTAVGYTVPYGFYSRDAGLEVSSIIKSVSAGKVRLVAISGNDAVASAFIEYLSGFADDAQGMVDRINYLPTREACLSSLTSGENDLFLGKFRKSEDREVNFIPVGTVNYSILVSDSYVKNHDIEKAVEKAMEATRELAVS